MDNFNTARTIDLLGYLPDVLKNTREMQAIMTAETPEIQALWQACEESGCWAFLLLPLIP